MPAMRVAPGRAAVLGLAVAAVLAVGPPPAAGATAIPADQGSQALVGSPITAIVGDIDDDGVRELITLRSRDDDPVHLAVEVLDEGSDGEVVSAGSAPLSRMASVTEQLSGLPRPDENNLLQARVDEPARLVVWHDDGRERVLAMAIGTLRNARACCLTIWAVRRDGDGIRLRFMTDTMRSADQVRVVDMDGDGTDELVVTEPRQDADPNVLPIAVLRWTGQRFTDQTTRLGVVAGTGSLFPMGNSDGLPGDEVGLLQASQNGATLRRIAMSTDGKLRADRATVPFDGTMVPIDGLAGRLILGDDGHRAVLLDWPAGKQAVIVRRSGLIGVPVMAAGRGSSARVVMLRDDRLLDVFSSGFGALSVGLRGSPAEARFRDAGVPPYVGPLPGGLPDGSAAFLFRGRLVRAERATPGGVDIADASVMPGTAPIGVFGRQSRLLALATPVGIGTDSGLDATREGGQLSQPAGRLRSTAIVVADIAAVLAPEADGGLLQPRLEGPIDVRPGDDPLFALAGGPFSVPVIGPPGTRIRLTVGEEVATDEVTQEGAVNVPVATAGFEDGDEVPVTLLAVTPTGQGYGGSWTVVLYTRPPALSATTPFASLSFDVSVSGRTAPDVNLVADGTPVAVASDGSFDLQVSAGLWPRDIQIEATDPLGNRSTRTVSVVALLDYRQLPWIPIVALLTILAGIVLYLKVPHARPATPSGPMTDATLEDLD